MTPLLNPQEQAEQLYNESLIRIRNTVERCFVVWKRRFPVEIREHLILNNFFFWRISLTNYIYELLDTNALFIHLAKTFDTVSHRILLDKIDHIGFYGVTFKLMESYLINCTN
nr:unnamed protein product [Callosobruchus chinensis]